MRSRQPAQRQLATSGMPSPWSQTWSLWRSTNLGPVQPFGVRKTIIGQSGRGGPSSARPRAALWMERILASAEFERGGKELMHFHRLVACDEDVRSHSQ